MFQGAPRAARGEERETGGMSSLFHWGKLWGKSAKEMGGRGGGGEGSGWHKKERMRCEVTQKMAGRPQEETEVRGRSVSGKICNIG